MQAGCQNGRRPIGTFPYSVGLDGLAGLSGCARKLAGDWTNAQFHLDLDASAQPEPAHEHDLFPAEATLRLSGNTNLVRIEQAAHAPWLTAETSPGATVDFHGRLLSPRARIELQADLAKQPWVPANGFVHGVLDFTPRAAAIPNAAFTLSSTNLENLSREGGERGSGGHTFLAVAGDQQGHCAGA